MSWQHILLAAIFVMNIVFSAWLVGDTREYTKGYVTYMAVFSAVMLTLLLWGQ